MTRFVNFDEGRYVAAEQVVFIEEEVTDWNTEPIRTQTNVHLTNGMVVIVDLPIGDVLRTISAVGEPHNGE